MFALDSAVGIEVQGDDLAFASVSKGLQDYTLKKYGVLENFREQPRSDLQHWMRQYAESNGLNRENIILGLPREQVVIRRVELPLEVEENLDQVVRLQVEKFEPLEEKQSCYDYLVVERNEKEKRIVLQITMVHRPLLEEYLDLLRDMDMYPAAVRVSSVGLQQVFAAHEDAFPKDNPCLVVAVDSRGAEFLLVAGKDQYFSEKVLIDQELTLPQLLGELDRFFSRLEGSIEALAKIYLTGQGGEQFLEGFQERFQDCELLSARLNVKSTNGAAGSDATALGLAISGTTRALPSRSNLIPAEQRVIADRPSLIPTLVLAALLLILGISAYTHDYFQQQRLLGQIRDEVRVLQPQVDAAMAVRDQITERRGQLEELQSMMNGRQRILSILQDLTERIPETSFLQNLNVRGERVSLTGFSDSASTLLKVLIGTESLGTVESRYIVPDRTQANREKFSFEATVKEENTGALR